MMRVDLEYNVQVTGLEEARAAAVAAAESSQQASVAMADARVQGGSAVPSLLLVVRSLNSANLAIKQTVKGIEDLNLSSLMYGFLSMVQVIRNLTRLTRTLKDSSSAAAGAQATLAALTGNWWIIPVALAAGALVYSQLRSMQSGGPVTYTGLHYLHEGEYVLPSRSLSSTHREYTSNHQTLGPIFITFQEEPRRGIDRDYWLKDLGPMLQQRIRRGS